MARQNKLLLNIDQNTTNEEKAMGRHNLGLADVAHTGSYNDLSDKPSIPDAPVQSDWNVTNQSSLAYIKNKPNLARVATTGSYNDLTDKPSPVETPEIVVLTHTQGSDTETPVAKLILDDDFNSITADNNEVGVFAPVPQQTDNGKMVTVNGSVLEYSPVPTGIPDVTGSDQYLTTNGSGIPTWEIKPVARAVEDGEGEVDIDVCKQIVIAQDYAKKNETVQLVGIGGGGSEVSEMGILPPANPGSNQMLQTNVDGKALWVPKYVGGTKIQIGGQYGNMINNTMHESTYGNCYLWDTLSNNYDMTYYFGPFRVQMTLRSLTNWAQSADKVWFEVSYAGAPDTSLVNNGSYELELYQPYMDQSPMSEIHVHYSWDGRDPYKLAGHQYGYALSLEIPDRAQPAGQYAYKWKVDSGRPYGDWLEFEVKPRFMNSNPPQSNYIAFLMKAKYCYHY